MINPGLDIFRLFSMYLIVLLHVTCIGTNETILSHSGTPVSEIYHFFRICCFCGVNCFALLSGYLGISNRFSLKKMLRLWGLVVFYSVVGTLVGFFLNGQFSILELSQSFFPITTGRYWYVTAYFPLFALMPLLNTGIQNLEKKAFQCTLITLFVCFCCLPLINFKINNTFGLEGGFSFTWLVYLYLLGAYWGKYPPFVFCKPVIWFVLGITCLFVVYCWHLAVYYFLPQAHHGREYMLLTYISPFMLCAASCFLFAFSKIGSQWQSSSIHFLSQCVFAVYLIHLYPVFTEYIMLRLGVFIAGFYIVIIPVLLILSAALIFVICLIIELLRRYVQKSIRGHLT